MAVCGDRLTPINYTVHKTPRQQGGQNSVALETSIGALQTLTSSANCQSWSSHSVLWSQKAIYLQVVLQPSFFLAGELAGGVCQAAVGLFWEAAIKTLEVPGMPFCLSVFLDLRVSFTSVSI